MQLIELIEITRFKGSRFCAFATYSNNTLILPPWFDCLCIEVFKYQFSVDYIFIMHFTTASAKTNKQSHMFHKKQTKKNAIVQAKQNNSFLSKKIRTKKKSKQKNALLHN